MEVIRSAGNAISCVVEEVKEFGYCVKNFSLATFYYLEYLCDDLIPKICSFIKDVFTVIANIFKKLAMLTLAIPVVGFLVTCPGVTIATFVVSWMRPKEMDESVQNLTNTVRHWWYACAIGFPITAYVAGIWALPAVAFVYCAKLGSYMSVAANTPTSP